MPKIDAYLKTLSHPMFMSFLYELSQDKQYITSNRDTGVLMGLFASSYLTGPGKNEPIVDTLRQFADPKINY